MDIYLISTKRKIQKDRCPTVFEDKNKNKNKNGKIGNNKYNNYTHDMDAPRKVYVKCGSINHICVHY